MSGENGEKRRELIRNAGYFIHTELENTNDISIYCIGEKQNSYILQLVHVFNEEKHRREIENRAESVQKMTARYPSVFLRYLEKNWMGDSGDFQTEFMIKMQYGLSMEQRMMEKGLTLEDVIQIGIKCAEALEACKKCGIPAKSIDYRMLYWIPEEGWKIGFFLADSVEKLVRKEFIPPEWIQNKIYDKKSEVYNIGMLLYLLMNEDEVPFLDICQTDEEAEEMRLSSAKPPLPLYGTETLKKIVRKACSARQERYEDVRQLRDILERISCILPQNWLVSEIYGHSYRDEEYMGDFNEEKIDNKITVDEENEKVSESKIAEKVKETKVATPKEYIKAQERTERRKVKEEEKKAREKVKEEEKKKKQIEQQLKRAKKEEQKKNAQKNGNKDRKDLIIIIGIITAVILVIAGIITGVKSSTNNKIYSYIDSRTYGTAMVELQELYESGKNVDKAAEKYAQSCLEDREYKRIPAAVQMLSEEYCETNKEFFENMIKSMVEDDKESRAYDLLDAMEACGGVRAEYASEFRSSMEGE